MLFFSKLFPPTQEDRLACLAERLRRASAVTPELMADFIAFACNRLPLLSMTGKAVAEIDRLIDAEAWIDTAIALIEIELPQWKLRRLLYEDGEWFCSLSKQPTLPIGTDESVDARHEILPLALLSVLLEAQRYAANGGDRQPVP